jgi:hypothetical protein
MFAGCITFAVGAAIATSAEKLLRISLPIKKKEGTPKHPLL